MKPQSFLAKFSIRTQILIGFVPVLLVLGLLGISSQYKFSSFLENFEKLSSNTSKSIVFVEIERDATELQRSVLVYAFYGYSGILKKIETLQAELDDKFRFVQSYADLNLDIKDRFDRLYGHYEGYNAGFQNVIIKKKSITTLKEKDLRVLHEDIIQIVTQIENTTDNLKLNLKASQLKNNQLLIFNRLQTFIAEPDAGIIRETRDLFADSRQIISDIQTHHNDANIQQNTQRLLGLIDAYEAKFKILTVEISTYLHLVNVVLAGKASEISSLGRELNALTHNSSQSLASQIVTNTDDSKNNFLLLSVIAALLGVAAIAYIALGISRPVKEMANTLSRLAAGVSDAKIPGLDRADEVGKMAQAANAFKNMAGRIKEQKAEILESQAKLSAIVDNMVDGLITISPKGHIESFNTACELIFGYRADEVMGENIKILMPEPYHNEHDDYLKNYKDTGKKKIIGIGREVRGRRKDGTTFEMDLSVSEISVSGKTLFSGIVRDITERKAFEKELADIREFQDLVINTIPDFVFVKDSEYKIVQANKAFINNYPPEKRDKVIGYTTLEEYSPQQMKKFTANDREALKEGYNEAQEDVLFPDGKTRNLFTKKVGFDSGGKRYLLGISRDITEMKNAEKEIIRSNEELERFAYIASHDLQEPLRMVSNFTGLLQEEYADEMDEQATQYMGFIIDASQRMHNLVSDLLEYSRAGHDDTGASAFDSRSKTETAISNLSESINETNSTITLDGEMPNIFANPIRFTRLMQNLVSNAIKYRSPEIKPDIHIYVEDADENWEFSIKDNGLGIKQEYLEQIFIIFKRLHNKSQYSGTGIGLAVCKKIVETTGGKLWVESEYGKGSIFKFTVPKHDE